MTPHPATRSIALYYPAAIWTDGNWLKTALIFFDEVALLRRDRAHAADTVLDQDVLDLLDAHKLVRTTEPATELDDAAAARLRAALIDKQVWEALDGIGAERRFYYGARVFSTLNGPEPSLEMMEMRNVLMERLGAGTFVAQEVGGHAYPTYRVGGQRPDLPVHIRLWAPLMSALPQYLDAGPLARSGQVVPLTDHDSGGSGLARLLDLDGMPSAGRVRVVEPVAVAPDLSEVPWPEVLSLRETLRADGAALLHHLQQAILGGTGPGADGFDDAAVALRRRLTELVGRRPLYQLGAVGAVWDGRPVGEDHRLAALSRLLGGTSEQAAAWTVVFRGGESIAARPTTGAPAVGGR